MGVEFAAIDDDDECVEILFELLITILVNAYENSREREGETEGQRRMAVQRFAVSSVCVYGYVVWFR